MWKELWDKHRGKCLGVGSGFVLGVIYLISGFWDMLIFAFIVFIGYYVGKKTDQREPMTEMGDLWRWLSDRWRMFR